MDGVMFSLMAGVFVIAVAASAVILKQVSDD